MTDIAALTRRCHDTGFEQGSIAACNAILAYLEAYGPHTAEMLKVAWEAGRVAEHAGLGLVTSDLQAPPPAVLLESEAIPVPLPLPALSREAARGAGYVGDPCSFCQSMQVKRNGSCLVCEACGQTTGCS